MGSSNFILRETFARPVMSGSGSLAASRAPLLYKKDIVKSVTYAARGHILGELLRHKPGQGRSRSRQKSAG
jgi:hypothetical protein